MYQLQDQLSRARSHHCVDNEPKFAILDNQDERPRIPVVPRFDSNRYGKVMSVRQPPADVAVQILS